MHAIPGCSITVKSAIIFWSPGYQPTGTVPLFPGIQRYRLHQNEDGGHMHSPSRFALMGCLRQAHKAIPFCNYGAGAYQSIRTDLVATNNSGIGADTARTPADNRLLYSCLRITALRGLITFVKTIEGPKKNIVLANHAFINRHIVLNLYIAAKHHMRTYHNILADIAVVADYTVGHDMREVPYFNPIA